VVSARRDGHSAVRPRNTGANLNHRARRATRRSSESQQDPGGPRKGEDTACLMARPSLLRVPVLSIVMVVRRR